MRLATCVSALLVAAVLVTCADARKTGFSTRRKTGGGNRRGGSSTKNKPPPPAPAPATPHKSTVDNKFLDAERGSSSHGTANTHHLGDPFSSNPSASHTPHQTMSQTNGPIGFDKLGQQGNHKIGFDKVNSEVQNKPIGSNIPSAPAYPGGASYPGKPLPSAPNGPPPAYPGLGSGTGTHTGGFEPPPAYPGRPVNAPPVYSPNNPSPNYGQRNPSYPNQQGGYPQQNGYPQQGGYPQQSGFPQQSGYPQQQGGYQQNAYPHQQGSYPGQQNFGYPNTGGFPNQGYNQGFGSYPSGGFGNSNPGGFGQSYPGYGGHSYGGSPFGQSNPYGGSPFGGSPGFGGNSFGAPGYNPHYSPNNFGYSNNPGLFGSQQSGYFGGGNNNYGYHKKSRFGGLPIPIPIPIPIPLGGFGGFGGRSHNHRVLDTFVKNQTINDNATTSVYILNNSTVTPCTTDQFIYDSLNVTVMSCTAGNCTSIKVFTSSNVSGEVSVQSAGITMCLEPNVTYSTFADNINPVVSDVSSYWMRVCKDIVGVSVNATEQGAANVTVKITETVLNESVANDVNATVVNSSEISSTTPASIVEVTTEASTLQNATSTPMVLNSTTENPTLNNSTSANSSFCEVFHCSWIEMCQPTVEVTDRCPTPDCTPRRTRYTPCVRLKMCQSPSTPVSTFASLNNSISRVDQFNNVSTVHDLANLTLISYVPATTLPVNCSQNATDPACQPTPVILPQEICTPANSTEAVVGGVTSNPNNGTVCVPTVLSEGTNSTGIDGATTEGSSIAPIL